MMPTVDIVYSLLSQNKSLLIDYMYVLTLSTSGNNATPILNLIALIMVPIAAKF